MLLSHAVSHVSVVFVAYSSLTLFLSDIMQFCGIAAAVSPLLCVLFLLLSRFATSMLLLWLCCSLELVVRTCCLSAGTLTLVAVRPFSVPSCEPVPWEDRLGAALRAEISSVDGRSAQGDWMELDLWMSPTGDPAEAGECVPCVCVCVCSYCCCRLWEGVFGQPWPARTLGCRMGKRKRSSLTCATDVASELFDVLASGGMIRHGWRLAVEDGEISGCFLSAEQVPVASSLRSLNCWIHLHRLACVFVFSCFYCCCSPFFAFACVCIPTLCCYSVDTAIVQPWRHLVSCGCPRPFLCVRGMLGVVSHFLSS